MLSSFVQALVANLFRLLNNPQRLKRAGEPIFWLAGFRPPPRPPRIPARVAILKLDRLGDVVISARFLAELRRAWPETRITLLVRESLVDLARLCPDVDEVIGVPVQEFQLEFDPQTGKYGRWKPQLAAWLKVCRRHRLWQKRFDAVIVARWDTDHYGAVPLAYLTGAPQRWGVTEKATARKATANRGFDTLLTHVITGQSVRHEFLLNDSLLPALGLPSSGNQTLVSWVRPADRKKAADILQQAGVVPFKKTVVVCMGANLARKKMWPVESYAQLFKAAFDLNEIQLVTFGTADEKELGLHLQRILGNVVINLEGRLPLALLPAAVSLGVLYVGSDTGTKHLAAAAGLPVLEVICHPRNGAPHIGESPSRFGAWGVAHRAVQPPAPLAPCADHCASSESHCIRHVTVEQAVIELRALLAETGILNHFPAPAPCL